MEINGLSQNRYLNGYSKNDQYTGLTVPSVKASKTAINDEKVSVKGGSIDASMLNIPGKQEEEKSRLKELIEQRMAVKNQMDQMGADLACDDEIMSHEAAKQSYKDEAAENYAQVERLTKDKDKLAEAYGIDPNSEEAKQTKILENAVIKLRRHESLTKEEMTTLESMDGLTEYQDRVLDYVDQIEVWQNRAIACNKAVTDEMHVIKDIETERLKSEPMLEIKKEMEEVIQGINEQITSAMTQEGLTDEDKKGLVIDQQV